MHMCASLVPPVTALLTYLSYAILILFGHARDFVGGLTGSSRYKEAKPKVHMHIHTRMHA
jgi:hypothetical protein